MISCLASMRYNASRLNVHGINVPTPLNEEHLLFVCPSVQQTRKETGLETLMTQYTLWDFPVSKMYQFFVNGLDFRGHPISLPDYFERGSTMSAMRAAWLVAY